MFKPVIEMSDDDIKKELEAISEYESVIGCINVEAMLNEEIDLSFLKSLGCTITPNRQIFRTDFQGFLPEMLETMYNDRKNYKKLMLQAEQEYENVISEIEKRKKCCGI